MARPIVRCMWLGMLANSQQDALLLYKTITYYKMLYWSRVLYSTRLFTTQIGVWDTRRTYL